MDIDKIALAIVIGLMMIVVLAIFFAIWCMCAAASKQMTGANVTGTRQRLKKPKNNFVNSDF